MINSARAFPVLPLAIVGVAAAMLVAGCSQPGAPAPQAPSASAQAEASAAAAETEFKSYQNMIAQHAEQLAAP
ncbi:MAG: hypothetical protein ACREPF_10080, partial [Rhodanobacteraceae bacterium]